MAERSFDYRPAVREQTPLLVGLIGPSGGGKTYSALRLATGIQRVSGGDIAVVDTEARRALHYADKFTFHHVAFGAPFSPLDYLAAIEHCLKKGAKTIIIDSTSHEHEGPGGVLEMHDAELTRMAGNDYAKRAKMTMLAWAKPKAQRRRLINSILQLPVNCIFCFRAKNKMKLVKGEDPKQLGFMPIAGEEFVYEMVMKCLLLPGANGVPTWTSDNEGEKTMIKIPEQFRSVFKPGEQLTESHGAALATWAAGAASSAPADVKELLARYEACSDPATFRALQSEREAIWKTASKELKSALKAAADLATERIMNAIDVPPSVNTDGEVAPPLAATGTDDGREPGSDG
jgi:ABC-type dipeptide/oligopeptide/nickel transport system ATPase subunit